MGFYIDNNSLNCLIKDPIVHFAYQKIKLLHYLLLLFQLKTCFKEKIMWVIIWTTITVVSILTNNAEGQVGSQSSNLPLTDTGDKKSGEEFFEV